jgi:hypothetical protein
MQGISGNFLIPMIVSNLREAADFEWNCPFKIVSEINTFLILCFYKYFYLQGNYSVKNFTPNAAFLPSFLRNGNGFLLNGKMMAKVKNQKSLVRAYTLTTYNHFE